MTDEKVNAEEVLFEEQIALPRLNEEITKAYVENYIATNEFVLRPTQRVIFYKMIKKYYGMLRDGKIPPPIQIDKNVIIDGHHRYISGHIYNSLPETRACGRPNANEVMAWNAIEVKNH